MGFFSTLLLISFLSGSSVKDSTAYELVIGSYTKEGNPGIEVYGARKGKFQKKYSLNNANASYQAISADTKYMFSVMEEGKGKSAVSSYMKNPSGEYVFINSEATIGNGPCFVAYREASQTLYAANYGGGSLSVFKTANGKILPIAQHIVYTGSGVIKGRQESPHAHQVVVSPDQQYIYVTDLGADKIHRHKIRQDGLVEERADDIQIKSGSGPRHLVFDKTGKFAYLITELGGAVHVFSVKDNAFSLVQETAADTASASPKGSADIHISPSGKWLISSNRITSNELTIFKILSNGTLEKMAHQPVAKKPRNFSFDPTGKHVLVASQDENKVQVFAFDDKKGTLKDTGQDIQVRMPVCLSFIRNPVHTKRQKN